MSLSQTPVSAVPIDLLERIAAALERLAPAPPRHPGFDTADAFIWHPAGRVLAPVPRVNRVEMSLLKGIDRMRDILVENTERFARGLPANNALLWGARGMVLESEPVDPRLPGLQPLRRDGELDFFA